MKFDSSDYLSYKKNRPYWADEKEPYGATRLTFMFKLFVATFIIIFIAVVIGIMKYSSRMDIEYAQGDLTYRNSEVSKNDISLYSTDFEDIQRKIDKRLHLIQQEENAPSEAKIINKGKNNPEVISQIHIEKVKKSKKNTDSKKSDSISAPLPQIATNSSEKTQFEKQIEENVTIMSKVLIGRYSTFDEATNMQKSIKAKNPDLTPFVKKVGDVFCVQMASYKDFSIAKQQAHAFRTQGYDVWIYQQ